MANKKIENTTKKSNEALVSVFIPKQGRNDTERFVAVNGERILVQTGKTVEVPKRFAEVIKNSENMATSSFSLSPEYHIVKESSVISSDVEIENEKTTFRWWIFIAIPFGVISAFAIIILIIRAYNIRKYNRLRKHRHYKRLGHDR